MIVLIVLNKLLKITWANIYGSLTAPYLMTDELESRAMKTKKPIKNNSYVTDSNFNKIMFTEKQAISFALNRVKELNNQMKRANCLYRYSLSGVKDCGTHYTYTIF